MNYPTPHIDARPEDFADTVLMPGDPLRAKYIAESFLEKATLVNNVRGIQGYTGFYKNTRVSVMASGMGMASIGIYSYELFNFFSVKNILRVGSAGGMQKTVSVRDVILGMGASTDSCFAHQYGISGTYAPVCSYALLEKAVETAKARGIKHHVGSILSTDVFYSDISQSDKWAKLGILAVEMEAAALYMNAARSEKNALAVLTVSDHLLTGESLSAAERQSSFNEMITLALETAISLEK